MSNLEMRVAARCDSALSNELIDASDMTPDQAVTIVGARHIDLLGALCRRNYVRAACQAADGPHDPDGPADVLIIPDYASETELCEALAHHGRSMAGDARVILRIARHVPLSRFFHMYDLFAREGFVLTQHSRRLSDGSTLHFARKSKGGLHALAA